MGLVKRFRLGWGKVRRAYIHMLNRDYLRQNHAHRSGECARCGACCELMFRCPYLQGDGCDTECVRHGTRWENCRIFPIDERDMTDRDLVARNGPCGYSFDRSKKPRRWLMVVVATLVSLSGLTGYGATARAGEKKAVKSERPIALRASFASGRAPEGWRIESGTWEPARNGLRAAGGHAAVAATLREDMTPVSGMDFRVEVWATFDADSISAFSSTGPFFHIGIKWGELEATMFSSRRFGRTDIAFGGKRRLSDLMLKPPVGRFRMEMALRRGLVSVRIGKERAFVVRDVFGHLAENAPRDIIVTASPGTVIHAVRVSATPARARVEALDRGDGAWREGDRPRAAISYMEALADSSVPAPARAEAACKLGLHFEAEESFIDAARSFDRAQRLDPEGPWAERARVALGRSALAVGDAKTALAFARAAARSAGRDIEDWAGFSHLVTRARKSLAKSGGGARATFSLRRIAEQLEWARSAPARTRWAWEEVALSLDGRGWEAEAEAIRKRAMRVLGRRIKVAASVMELTSEPSEPAETEPSKAPSSSPSGGEAE